MTNRLRETKAATALVAVDLDVNAVDRSHGFMKRTTAHSLWRTRFPGN